MLVDSLPQGRLVSQDLLVCGDRLFFRAVGGRYDILWSSLGDSGTTTPVPGMRKAYRVAYDLGLSHTWNLWNVNGRLVLGVLSFSRTYLYEVDAIKGAPAPFAQPYDDTYSKPGPTKTALAGPYLFLSSPFGITETDGTAKGTRRLLKGVSGTYEFSFRTTRDIYLSGNNEYPPSPGLWKLPKKAKAPVFVGPEIPLEGTPIINLGKNRYFLSNDGYGTALIRQDLGTGSVSGIVYHDLGGFNQKPMAGITVFIDLNADGRLNSGESSAVSDGNGKYEVNVKPGTWKLGFVGPSMTWKQTTPQTEITVIADQQTQASIGVMDTAKSSTISGYVYRDSNKDGNFDTGEGFRSAQVYADLNKNQRHDSGEPISLSDADGTYSLSRLVEGGYSVRIVPQRRWYFGEYDNVPFYLPDPKNVVAGSGQVTRFDLRATKKARLSGFVFNDVNANSIRDPGEPGLSGRMVSLSAYSSDWLPGTERHVELVGKSVTSEVGFYSFLVPTLEVYLSFSPPAGMRETLTPSLKGPVPDGAVLAADCGFTEQGKLTGNVSVDY